MYSAGVMVMMIDIEAVKVDIVDAGSDRIYILHFVYNPPLPTSLIPVLLKFNFKDLPLASHQSLTFEGLVLPSWKTEQRQAPLSL